MSTPAVRQELDRTGRLVGLREQMRRERALKSMLGEDETESDTENPKTDS